VQKQYLKLTLALVLTAFISVSIHIVILQFFQAPPLQAYPLVYQYIGYIIRFGTVIATMFIYFCSKEYWLNFSLTLRVILFAMLILALTENLLRNSIMQIIIGIPWLYQLIKATTTYTSYLFLSLIICTCMQAISKQKNYIFIKYVMLAVITTGLFYHANNFLHYGMHNLLLYVTQPQQPLSTLPYNMHILISAYITYLEPTLAAFIVFFLIKNKLQSYSTLMQGLILSAIIITIHAGFASLFEIIFSQGNIVYRLFYYGQFIWEYLSLGVLTAYSINRLQNSRKLLQDK
jgi:hypothetical protein